MIGIHGATVRASCWGWGRLRRAGPRGPQPFQRLLGDRTTPQGIAERARVMVALLDEAERTQGAAGPAKEKPETPPRAEPVEEKAKAALGQTWRNQVGEGNVAAQQKRGDAKWPECRPQQAAESCAGAMLSIAALALLGCGDSLPRLQDLNPFAEKEVPLPGKRIAILQQESIRSDAAAASRPVALPPPQANDDLEPAGRRAPATRPAIWLSAAR